MLKRLFLLILNLRIKVGLKINEKVSRILKLKSCSSEREWFEADDVVDVYKGAGDIEVEADVGGVHHLLDWHGGEVLVVEVDVDGGLDDRSDLDQVPCSVGRNFVF